MKLLADFLAQIVRAVIFALAAAALFVEGAPAPAFAKDKPAAADKTAAKGKDAKDAKGGDAKSKEAGKDKTKAKTKEDAAAPDEGVDQGDSKSGKKKDAKNQKGGKPEQLGTHEDWGAFATSGKDKTCYALGAPKDRSPKVKLKDTSAYVFISTRPGEGVKNEVAINLGYPTKDGSAASAVIDGDDFELVTKGENAWLKNAAEEPKFVAALKGGSKLVVKAASAKGTATVDTYSLKGLSDALTQVAQECK
jgi:hypothetical protein